jgi:hypothetical protein
LVVIVLVCDFINRFATGDYGEGILCKGEYDGDRGLVGAGFNVDLA